MRILLGRTRPSYVSIKEVSLWLQAARWYTRSTCHTARGRGRIRSPPGIGNLNNRKNVFFSITPKFTIANIVYYDMSSYQEYD